ncbi:MAG: o-succinylbenzoate synthase [Cocleimonas sp.]|nr:o-succinylbenzoate synthase [Cocleimonas sp.]
MMQTLYSPDQPLAIEKIELTLVDLPQHEVFVSAVGARASRKALIVKCTDQSGNIGYGECSSRTDPYYSHEFLEGCVLVIQQFILPFVHSDNIQTFAEFEQAVNRIKGWEFAKAAVFDAIFNTWFANNTSDPLSLSQRAVTPLVPIGISLGIYADLAVLLGKISAALEQGYRRIKMKVSPEIGAAPFQAVRKNFPDIPIILDANGSFGEQEFDVLAQLALLNLEAIEQPFAADRLDLCQKLRQAQPDLRVCLDESVDSIGQLYSALQMNALDELNIKVGRVGGLFTAMKLDEICVENGIPSWAGGMFETGVGRTNNLRFAATLAHAKAHDISPSRRYFIEDIIQGDITMTAEGYTPTPQIPPLVDEQRLEKYKVAGYPSNLGE